MKPFYIVFLSLSFLFLTTCEKNKSGNASTETSSLAEESSPMAAVIEAHGGLKTWNDMHTLFYQVGNESHTIDLKSREIKIEAPGYTLGNDDGTVWIDDPTGTFKKNPTFYHSLMFYFYAMPFVLSDPGVNYEKALQKELNGTVYESIKVTFNKGVGDSPEDEYILYYDPETQKMEWLAYTVTFQSGEESDNFSMIHYSDWQEVNGLLLTKELQWYNYSDRKLDGKRGEPVVFSGVNISADDKPEAFYDRPEGATVDS